MKRVIELELERDNGNLFVLELTILILFTTLLLPVLWSLPLVKDPKSHPNRERKFPRFYTSHIHTHTETDQSLHTHPGCPPEALSFSRGREREREVHSEKEIEEKEGRRKGED